MDSFSIASLAPSLKDVRTWPQVDEHAIEDREKRSLFLRRYKAIKLLLDDTTGSYDVVESGVTRREAMRLLKRCLCVSPDGQIYGFRALIPNLHIAKYTRRARPGGSAKEASFGAAGAFQQLIHSHPILADLIEDEIFRLSKRQRVYESRIPIKSLHKRFIDKCRELGLEADGHYPFNTKALAYISLVRYVRHLLSSNPERATISTYGSDIAKKWRSSDGTARPVIEPFERVECDAHHIDAVFCILIPSLFGELIPKVVHRLWLIVIKDISSKAILGYHLSLRDECNADDVLLTIRHALSEWTPRTLTIPGMTYGKGSGFPSSRDKRFIGACWQEFSVDGALANLSTRVADKLEHLVGAKPIVLPRRIPNDRPFVERFFGALEEGGFHRLPNTTGNRPSDPRRNNPDQAAVHYRIQIEHLEDLLDVLIANFNGTPHGSIGYRSPLDYLMYLCQAHDKWPRNADPEDVDRVLNLFKTVTVRGGVENGRRPYIHYLGVNYSSDVLRLASHLVGQKLSIEIFVKDLRFVRAYGPNGAEIGILRAAPPWHRTPHTVEMRQAVNSLVHRKILHYLDQTDPVMALLKHLESLAIKGKSVPSLYLEARRVLADNLHSVVADRPSTDTTTHAIRPRHAVVFEEPPARAKTAPLRESEAPLPPFRKAING